MSAAHILHLVPAEFYRATPEGQPYLPAEFEADGFIHCTAEPETLLEVANAFYRQAPGDFLVLVIDVSRLSAPVRYEPPAPAPPPGDSASGRLFPHIYGPLNREAIVAARPARRTPDGAFVEV